MQNLNPDTTNLENAQVMARNAENNPNIQEPNKPAKQPKIQCKYCSKTYKILVALKNHEECCPGRINNASEDEKELVADKIKVQEERQHTCKDCGQTFKYAKILQKHEAMHKGKFPYWCKLCMLNFATHDEKVLHKMNEHPTKGKKHKCKICQNKLFDTEEEFLFHINEIHKGKFDDYYMCSDCGKQFKTKSELTHHNNSKCGTVKQYQCKVCSQYLMTAGSLHNHMLRHTGEQGCMCWYCGKTFLTIGQLKVHERTHTQEKAFVCDVCGKGFCHRQSLITHSTLHTGVKPYQCENCGHSFSCVGNLIKHRRTHADTCGKMPLTSHRVNNPSTKMKVKINTPESSKLKAVRKEKELQTKLAAYKEKLNLQNSCSSDSSQSKTHEDDDLNEISTFKVKSESGHKVPYIANNFIQTKMFEMEDTKLAKDYATHETEEVLITKNYAADSVYEKQPNNCTNNKLPDHSNGFANKHDTEVFNNWGYLSEASSEIENRSVKHYPPDINNAVVFDNLNGSMEDYESKTVGSTSETYLCHTNGVKHENYETDDDCDNDEHQYDDYDSEDCCSVKITEEVVDGGLNRSPQKRTRTFNSSGKQKQDKITEKEVEEFVKHRGFAFKADGSLEGTCQYCTKVYTNMRWLLRHEKEHAKKIEQTHKGDSYKCRCCKTGFDTREACKVHQQDMHADILTCQACDKLFSNVDSLRSHQNIFHKGLPRKVYVYVCEKCGLQFRQKAFLSHHEKNNCGAGPVYECHVCGKGFNSVHTRRSHLRIHDPKKRFLCKFCGKNFRWKGQLKVHERSHTGEKPFKCLYCPKAFGYRESLVTHSSLHTGIKPHLCQACGSRFSCIGNLIKHRTTHASTCGVWYSKNQ